MEKVDRIPLIVFFLSCVGIFLFFDYIFDVSVSMAFTSIYCLISCFIGIFFTRRLTVTQRSGTLILLIVLLFSVRFIDWNSRKSFLKDLYKIHPGMNVKEVDSIMGKYEKNEPDEPTGSITHSASSGYVIYHHTHEAWGNADTGIVKYERDQVVEVTFSDD